MDDTQNRADELFERHCNNKANCNIFIFANDVIIKCDEDDENND
jgi:hypothetical protein